MVETNCERRKHSNVQQLSNELLAHYQDSRKLAAALSVTLSELNLLISGPTGQISQDILNRVVRLAKARRIIK